MTMPRRILRALAQAPIGPDGRGLMKHQAFIRSLPCVACGKPAPSECARVGGGLQPHDGDAVPLCGPATVWDDCCHSRQHQRGRARFWSELGIDPRRLADRLWQISGDSEAGQHMVRRARQAIARYRVASEMSGSGVTSPRRADAVLDSDTGGRR